MHPLGSELVNSIANASNDEVRKKIKEVFPALNGVSHDHYLYLRKYVSKRPEKFFDNKAFEIYFEWLLDNTQNGNTLKKYLEENETEIDRSILYLDQINRELWHDRVLNIEGEYVTVNFIDKHLHPAYLRIVEAVLAPLLRPIAYVYRKKRNKGTEGLDTWSIVEELLGSNEEYLTKKYHHIIRNGIAHGQITFYQHEISYKDKRGNKKKFSLDNVVSSFDDILDTCNGIIVAIKLFYAVALEGDFRPPQQLFIEELKEATNSPWWSIEGCLESTTLSGVKQLIIYAKPNSRDYSKIFFIVMQSGILTEYFAPGYDRYFFSLRSNKAFAGWAAFNGKKLKKLRERNATKLEDYKGIIEGNQIFYESKIKLPRILSKLDTFYQSFKVQVPITIEEIRKKLEIPVIICREASIHRNGWRSVVKGRVVIEGVYHYELEEIIHSNVKKILKRAVKKVRSESYFNWLTYIPVGFIQVSVYQNDYRVRDLTRYGLKKDLVCTIRKQSISRIKSPDIFGLKIENFGKYKIAWNQAWLNQKG